MNIRLLIIIFQVVISGCAHTPKCGNPDGAKIIYEGKQTCTVRIRSIIVGSELKIPESIKNPEIVTLGMEWVDPVMKDGQIIMGHFVMTPGNKKLEPQPVTKVTP